MKFDILTLFPEAFSVFFNTSIIGNAVKKGLISYECINFRNFSEDKHNRVDDYTYGGGKGMLIGSDAVFKAYDDIVLKAGKRPKMIYLSPRGKVLNQEIARSLAHEDEIILLCGHYEGVDQRIIDELCDYELSVGDFVLTGGELPAMILCDCVSRLVTGVLSSEESFTEESHYSGLLEYNQYTIPETYNGLSVPDVLISGNKSDVEKWRSENAKEVTALNRPDIYKKIFGFVPDIKKADIAVNLIILGSNSVNKDEILLQLNKRNISCNVFDEETVTTECFSGKTAIIICGDYPVFVDDILKNSDTRKCLYQILRPFSEKRISQVLIPDLISEYQPVKKNVTASEFAEEVVRYSFAYGDDNEIHSCILEGVKFICSVPYVVYETYYDVLKNFDSDKIFCVTSSNVHFQGECVLELICDTKIKVNVFSFRSKVYGRIQLVCVNEKFDAIYKFFDREINGQYKCYLK